MLDFHRPDDVVVRAASLDPQLARVLTGVKARLFALPRLSREQWNSAPTSE